MSAQHPKYWLAYLSESPENRPNEITTTAPEILDRPRFSSRRTGPARRGRRVPRRAPASPGGVRGGGDTLAPSSIGASTGMTSTSTSTKPSPTSTPTLLSC